MQQQRGSLYTFIFATIICLFCSVLLAFAATALKPRQTLNARLDIVKNILAVAGYVNQVEARGLAAQAAGGDLKAPALAKLTSISTEKAEAFVAKAREKKGELTDEELSTYLSVAPTKPDAILALFRERFDALILDKNNKEVPRSALESELKKLKYSDEELTKLMLFELVDRFNGKKSLLAARSNKTLKEYDPHYKLIFLYRPEKTIEAYIIPIQGNGLWDVMKGYVALKSDLNHIKGITFYEHKETPGLGGECEKPWFRNNFIDKTIFNQDGKFVSVAVAKGKATDKYSGAELNHYVDGMSGATLTGNGITNFLYEDLKEFEAYFKAKQAESSKGPEAAPEAKNAARTRPADSRALRLAVNSN